MKTCILIQILCLVNCTSVFLISSISLEACQLFICLRGFGLLSTCGRRCHKDLSQHSAMECCCRNIWKKSRNPINRFTSFGCLCHERWRWQALKSSRVYADWVCWASFFAVSASISYIASMLSQLLFDCLDCLQHLATMSSCVFGAYATSVSFFATLNSLLLRSGATSLHICITKTLAFAWLFCAFCVERTRI